MRRKYRRVGVALAAVSMAIGIVCGACPFSRQLVIRPALAHFDSRYMTESVDPMPLDRDLWQRDKACHRVAMAHELVENKRLDGKTHAELVEMLGRPDIENPGDEGMRWLLGYYAKGLFDESIWLGITIKDGSASGAIIFTNWDDPRDR